MSNMDNLTRLIRNALYKGGKSIKIMWVPSHVLIPGNEAADERVKLAAKEPLIVENAFSKKDIYRLASEQIYKTKLEKWKDFKHHYANVNVNGEKPIFPEKISSNNLKAFIRLRIGHTIVTHESVLKGSRSPQCSYCNVETITVTHLLDRCQHFATIRASIFNTIASKLLKNQDIESWHIIPGFS
ncbi:uncharacterized protein LOC118750344 [Rhagoletis pomonella]|uniref:uncharacterized protein LOC118750344 n=1 Tax=Rhagoletis pomonella TaxID=28610 RepID=UPI001787127B|nr:uncharacterized protein LOC118750344 [Rhagoletis pomonella]